MWNLSTVLALAMKSLKSIAVQAIIRFCQLKDKNNSLASHSKLLIITERHTVQWFANQFLFFV